MTQGDKFNIQSVAIIGSGAAGLTTLFELLNTKKEGSTALKYTNNGELDVPALENNDPAFTKLVAFEQTSRVGGIWAPSFDSPDIIPQEALDTEKYNDPFILKPKTTLPQELGTGDYSQENPLYLKNKNAGFTWNNSGIYRHLYSNVPNRYLRNSFIPYEEKPQHEFSTENVLDPLITNSKVTNRLLQFAEKFHLVDHVRLNSEVVDIRKTSDGKQWKVTVKKTSKNDPNAQWYTEYFDAVIVSTGHYSVPYIPRIKGLSSWNKELPSSLFHSKSFRDPKIFKDKVCLFVGTGLSGIDILQYAFPVAKQVIVSRSVGKEEIYEWLTKAANSDGLIVKPRIKELKPSKQRKVIFEDDSIISGVDYIIFSTGYHWHYPFLNTEDTGVSIVGKNGASPDGSSMVKGLYRNTFSIKDPTLAFVGVTLTPFKWPSFELEAAAIAGTWTNNGAWPDKQDQVASVQIRVKQTGESILFHYYPVTHFAKYIEEVREFLPKGRDATTIFDADHIDDMYASMVAAERLFYQLKNGEIPIEDTVGQP